MTLKEAHDLFESTRTSRYDFADTFYREGKINIYVSYEDPRLANVPVIEYKPYKSKMQPMSLDFRHGKEFEVQAVTIVLDGRECCKALNKRYFNYETKCVEEWNGKEWVVRPRKEKRG